MYIIENALEFALSVHRGVPRKYSAEPYIYHPFRVSLLAQEYYDPKYNLLTWAEYVSAAILHDCIEDSKGGPYNTYLQIINFAGPRIAEVVYNLSNPSQINPDYKKLRRKERKDIDIKWLVAQDYYVKLLKLLDRYDNINSLYLAEKGYQRLYCGETEELVAALVNSMNIIPPVEKIVGKIDGILTQIKCGWGV